VQIVLAHAGAAARGVHRDRLRLPEQMQLPPIFDVRKLGRYFSRDLPQDKINKANGQIQYVKEHGIIQEHEEPAFAQEVAPRRVKKVLRKIERYRELDKHSGRPEHPGQIARTPDAMPLEPPRREPLLLPPHTNDDRPAE
jgi:hypothetical protein